MQSNRSEYNRSGNPSRPNNRRDSSDRPHPYRTASDGSFSSSYTSTYTETRSSATPSGRWEHDKNDLFEGSSSLYNPVLGIQRGIPASASLRPFGTATPLPHQAIPVPLGISSHPTSSSTSSSAEISRTSTPSNAASPATENILQRFGIKGSSNDAAEKKRQIEIARLAREAEKKSKANREAEERSRRELEAQYVKEHAKAIELAKIEDRGFVVEVAGLVYGTSADDVQTAFGAYGETTHCIIVNADTAQEGDELVARLVFERYSDADEAVQKLNGAVADGKPLRVKRGERTVVPPPPTFNRTSVSKASPNTARRVVVDTPVVVVASGSRKMYADEVETFDPRLRPAVSTSAYPEVTAMDMDMDVEMGEEDVKPIPTGPRAGTRGKGNGRGNGRGGLANDGQRLVTPVTSSPSTGGGSLMDRLSGGGGRGGGNNGNSRNTSNTKGGKGAAGMAGLLGRMN